MIVTRTSHVLSREVAQDESCGRHRTNLSLGATIGLAATVRRYIVLEDNGVDVN